MGPPEDYTYLNRSIIYDNFSVVPIFLIPIGLRAVPGVDDDGPLAL